GAGEWGRVAVRAVRKGGMVVLAGIHMSPIPAMDYGPHLFHEKTLRSVEANTRQDGGDLLREAAAAGIRPSVAPFPLEAVNEALIALKRDRLNGTGVLAVDPDPAKLISLDATAPAFDGDTRSTRVGSGSGARADDELERRDPSSVDRAQVHGARGDGRHDVDKTPEDDPIPGTGGRRVEIELAV